ncbi:758_t:CDS:2 [Paraglomus brasilianum]|uniref:758_t:CDS:1 n=1 Tax=Paraglomus brasilianum TaxID=144538 RepID=A0A9N9GGC5_9GLOM|nr:758_t:CDS:2 [Paraglomus brasilianum]
MEGIGRQDELNPSSEEDLLSARYHLFGMRQKVILDTGAEINVIASHIVQLNGWKDQIKKNTEKFVGIGGKPTDVDGEITLSVQLTNRTVHKMFVVIPVRHIVAILDTSLMLRHGVKISYKKKQPSSLVET